MLRHDTHHQQALDELAGYIRDGETAKFIERFELVAKTWPEISCYLLQNGHSIHQIAMLHNRKEIFEYLVNGNYSERDLIRHVNISFFSITKTYIQAFQRLFQNEAQYDDINYWLAMLTKHRHLILFDVTTPCQDLTLLQMMCLLPEISRQKLVEHNIPQKLFDLGAKQVIDAKSEYREQMDAANIAMPDLLNPRSARIVIEEMLISYSAAGNTNAVGKLLEKIARIEDQQRVASLLVDENDNPVSSLNAKGKEEIFHSARIKHIDKEDIPSIDSTRNTGRRTALNHATAAGHTETVRLLLKYGASPLNGMRIAINDQHKVITQLLLQHGGGIFSDLPKSFLWMGINANDCYVEGMSIGGHPVTRNTPGFYYAIHDAHELIQYNARQNKLAASVRTNEENIPGFRNFIQPLHSIKSALRDLDGDVRMANIAAFINAYDVITKISNVPSLQWMVRSQLRELRDEIEVDFEGSALSLYEYLEKLDPKLSAAVFNIHADKQHALAILNDRIDELTALHKHLQFLLTKDKRLESSLACPAKISCCSMYLLPTLYGIYTMFAFIGDSCCMCCGHPVASTSGKCSSLFVARHAMYFFGIPGIVISSIVLLSIAILTTYRFIYGPNSLSCCYPMSLEPRVNKFADVQPILRALSELLKDENLPDNVKDALHAISQPDSTLYRILSALITIRTHYQQTEINQVAEDTSPNPYHTYKPNLFFWTEAQRAANRNNKLPQKIAMDETATDIQSMLGYSLFTMIQVDNSVDDAPPVSIQMEEYEQPAPPTENTPLLGTLNKAVM
jgi:hypothetical protein